MQQKYFHADGTESTPDKMTDMEMMQAGLTQRARDNVNYKNMAAKKPPAPVASNVEAAPPALPDTAKRTRPPDRKLVPESVKADYDGIQIKPSHKGLLHKNLGVPQGSPIPMAKIESAESSSSPAVRKRAVFAENAKKWNK